jgi:ribonuclease HI
MRQVWTLPSESEFAITGEEWFLQLLSRSSREMRARIMFLFWRAWHHRNNIVHGDGKASITASVSFLENYMETLQNTSHAQTDDKGKMPMFAEPRSSENLDTSVVFAWSPPPLNGIKANVDAGWDALSGHAGVGVVLRNHEGRVLLSAWRPVADCASAEEAEVVACLEGLRHLAQHPHWIAILESDCARVIQVLSNSDVDRSPCWNLFAEAKALMETISNLKICKIGRVSNGVAHGLAQLGKRGVCGVMHDSVPSCVSALVERECTNAVT